MPLQKTSWSEKLLKVFQETHYFKIKTYRFEMQNMENQYLIFVKLLLSSLMQTQAQVRESPSLDQT